MPRVNLWPWLRPFLILVLVVATPLLIYWFVYVQSSVQAAKQQAYVTLSAVATNLKDRLAAHQQIAATAERLQYDPRHLKAYLNSVLQPKRIVLVPAQKKLHLEVGSVSGGLYLQVGTLPQKSDVDCGASSCSMRAVLPLENLIPWSVVQTEFDGLLVLSDAGELLAQDRRLPGQPLGVKVPLTGLPADLAKLLNMGNREESAAPANQGAKENSSRVPQALSPLDFSDGISLQLAGTDYLAFLQPVWVVVTAVGQNDPADSATTSSTLKVMVCGLIQKDRLRRQAIELAPQTLIAIGAFVALGLFAIPFLKLRFIGARERMHPRDVWLLAASLLCATAAMVLIVMDARAYDKLLDRFDAALQGFSTTVRTHIETEASQAIAQLTASAHLLLNTTIPPDGNPAESNCEYRLATGTSANSPLPPGAPVGSILSIGERFAYPDFEALVATDLCGNQIRKIMPRTIATPYINVLFEPYFYPAVTLTARAGAAPFSYAAIVAPTSGLQLSVFAMPLDLNTGKFGAQLETASRNAVIAAATQLRSVSAPLVAQPFQFVLINRQGAVTYQQAQGPFTGERFFDAVVGGSTLEQSARGSNRAPQSYQYRGQTYRMYAVDIPELQLTLVAYYDRATVGSLAARMFGTAALFALGIILSMLVGGAIAVCWFGETALDWVWPSAERTPLYLLGCAGCIASLGVLWVARNTLSSTVFMGFLLLAPLISMIVLGSGYVVDALQRLLDKSKLRVGAAMLKSRRLTSLIFQAFAVMVMLAFVAWPTLVVFDDAYTLHATAFASGVAKSWKTAKQQWIGSAAANVMNIGTALPILDCKKSADLRCNAPDRVYATRENYAALLDVQQRLGMYNNCVNLVNEKDGCEADTEPAVPSSSTLPVAYQLAGFGRGNVQLAQILSSFFTAQPHAPRAGLLEGYQWSRWTVGGFIFVISALCLLIGSVAKHVLGIGMTNDGVLDERNEFAPKDGTRWLLLRPGRDALARMNDAVTLHVDLRDAQPLPARQPPVSGRVLCIHHLESRLADSKWRAGVLQLLEADTAGCMVLTSEIDPLHYLTQRAREREDDLRALAGEDHAKQTDAECRALRDELSNWARALREVQKIREGLPDFEIPEGGCADPHLRAMIIAECNRSEPLVEIGTRLLSAADLAAYRWDEIVGFVLDAAEPYYRSIWELCSREERLVLIQLAQEGLLNPKRLEIVRRLARRGLVNVDPRFQLMNESFRRFVRTVETPERIAEWERTTSGMSWSRLGTPLYAFAAVAIAILLYTQQAMFTSVLAIATGAAGTIGSLRSLYASAIKPAMSTAKLA